MAENWSIKWNGQHIRNLTRQQVARGIGRATLSLERDAKISIGTKGELIRKTTTGREVRAPSLPGEPPHRQTGTLVSSVGHEMSEGGLVGRVGTSLAYGRFLEFGTRTIAARPWLRPAFDRTIAEPAKFFGAEKPF